MVLELFRCLFCNRKPCRSGITRLLFENDLSANNVFVKTPVRFSLYSLKNIEPGQHFLRRAGIKRFG